MTDEELFAAYVAGDESSFNEIVARYTKKLLRYAARKLRGDENSAEDVVQVAFTRVVKHRHEFQPGKMLQPWLYTITDRLCRDYLKAVSRRTEHVKLFTDRFTARKGEGVVGCSSTQEYTECKDTTAHLDHSPGPQEVAEGDEMSALVTPLLGRLPVENRVAIWLTIVQGLSHRQAGAAISVSHTQIRRRCDRGLNLLREAFASGASGVEYTEDNARQDMVELSLASTPDADVLAIEQYVGRGEGDHTAFAGFIRGLVGSTTAAAS